MVLKCVLLVMHTHTHFKQEVMPFAIVGSNTLLEVNGKRVRGRLYPWGVVEVENKDHCDFVKLRNMLIRFVLAVHVRQPEHQQCVKHCLTESTPVRLFAKVV